MSALDDAEREIWDLKVRLDALQPLLALLFADYARREPAKFNDVRELLNDPLPADAGRSVASLSRDGRAIFSSAAEMAKHAAEKEVEVLSNPFGQREPA